MCTCNVRDKDLLEKRLEQHEQTISQLIGMVAATNGRLTQIIKEMNCSHGRPPTP
ncbi:MAG TPA: hypothetical protein VK144_05150 [Bacillota bacterium]|nr:hypothetical protein [Bacillota bacterium]